MTIRIVYFSWKGHTEKIAKVLADQLHAELVRIEPDREPGISKQAMKAMLSMKSAIKPSKTDLAGIDELVVATPVWAGKVPPYVNEYLNSVTGGQGKPFHVFIEMGGRGAEGAIALVRKHLEEKGMRFVSSAWTVEAEVESGAFMAKVEAFAAGIRKEPEA